MGSTLRIAKFIGDIKCIRKVAVVVVKEKRKKPVYLVCTNIHLPAIDIIKYYAKRWKIEQMIKAPTSSRKGRRDRRGTHG